MVWFDRRVGPVAGTTRRIARASGFNGGEASNFDCFDTTRNTSSLFLILRGVGIAATVPSAIRATAATSSSVSSPTTPRS